MSQVRLADRGSERPPRTEKIAEVVARRILRDITVRQLPVGTTLPPEAKMLATYGVSRASLREALRILETQGLIMMKPGPGGGPIVAGVQSADFGKMATMYFHMDGATFRELLEARLIIEPMMAGLATRCQIPEDLAALEESTRTSNEADDVESYTRRAHDFHSLIAGMSGNRVLDLIGRGLKDIYVDRIRQLAFPETERDQVEAAHRAIAEAVVAGDADAAERLMRQHMQEFAAYATARFPGLLDEVVDWR